MTYKFRVQQEDSFVEQEGPCPFAITPFVWKFAICMVSQIECRLYFDDALPTECPLRKGNLVVSLAGKSNS